MACSLISCTAVSLADSSGGPRLLLPVYKAGGAAAKPSCHESLPQVPVTSFSKHPWCQTRPKLTQRQSGGGSSHPALAYRSTCLRPLCHLGVFARASSPTDSPNLSHLDEQCINGHRHGCCFTLLVGRLKLVLQRGGLRQGASRAGGQPSAGSC